MNKDRRKYAAATQRNREPILAVLQRILPPQGNVLEIASGTGEHAVYFAPQLLPRLWIPSEPNAELRQSILAWQEYEGVENMPQPLDIDAADLVWAVEEDNISVRAIAAINMIHISPWESCLGLLAGAGRILPSGGILYLYGPYKQGGKHTAPSNQAFDQMLQTQNPAWGVRNLEDVVAIAVQQRLKLLEVLPMPANNLSVVFEHQ